SRNTLMAQLTTCFELQPQDAKSIEDALKAIKALQDAETANGGQSVEQKKMNKAVIALGITGALMFLLMKMAMTSSKDGPPQQGGGH
ncbi:MAG TPA: hypothetical protein VK338_03935, partial [Candidatus Nitrosocosmicus sp.]|nr:hypothetical protein [Candidatus Nitrosocosmicus sp.]